MVFKSFDTLRQAGFDNLNVDLMFAIPGQSLEIWRETLREAIALGSEHLSSYEVIYEEDTPLYAQLKAREFDVDEDLANGRVYLARETLERFGIADLVAAPINRSFAYVYRYGDAQARGFEDGGPKGDIQNGWSWYVGI